MGKVNPHILLTILIVALTINVFFLDILFFTSKPEPSGFPVEIKPESVPAVHSECLDDCLKAIKAEVAREIAKLPTPTPLLFPKSTNPTVQKEMYIPLGSGSTNSTEWSDLPSVEVYIDTSKYGTITNVIFESYLRIGTGVGTVYAKLYNVTDQHDVWFSEVSAEGNETFRREAEITLESGRKLYRIMAKSRLGAEAFIENARIKILTK